MKSGVSSSYAIPVPAKRRWRGLVIAVLALVFLSMLLPLVFLLGLHNGFHSTSGYGTDHRNSAPTRIKMFDQHNTTNQPKEDKSNHVDAIIKRFTPTLPKGFGNASLKATGNGTNGYPVPIDLPIPAKKTSGSLDRDKVRDNTIAVDESEMICQLKFGSYCLWRREQRVKMEDSVVKTMKDLLFVARAYYPSIAKLPKFDKLSQEMKQNIQDFERILSEATTDKDLPPQNKQKIKMMEATIAKAKACPVDCNNVDKKFRQLVDLTEDEANFHMKQSAFLYKLAVQTMPKSLHCLSMRLTVEYFRSFDIDDKMIEKFVNPDLHHYVIFSKNVLASSVAINSTVAHAQGSEKLVFHLLTDKENFFAMKLWFFRNKYADAAVQVLNIEDLKFYNYHKAAPLHLSLPEDFRVSFRRRDLSALWNLDMGEKVNGAVQLCAVKLFDLKSHLLSRKFDENSCAWTSGVNIIDLSTWRVQNLTGRYRRLMDELKEDEHLSETTGLSAGLLTFDSLVYPLEDSWILPGLGYNYGIDLEDLKTAAILHFDGSMKPWLDLGIPRYKRYWRKFLDPQNQFLSDCNVNP
ncbi:probable galacturonosyltransferase 7 isoform X3 [Salvia hispanica]|uniref:probable galacturonosyltransferase 7 isoform X3 n=1 Tax=Salvia hispanica TaxID=49212 RepID=UPI0020091714|nr:probable galacturonosyltransferase 7 isoform X3 [Salvia hispanica]